MLNIFKKRNSKSQASNTGYKGITFRKDTNMYQSQVYLTKKDKQFNAFSKVFKTLPEAIKAREEFIDSLY